MQVDSALIFFPESDVRGLLVEADTKAFQLSLDDLLVAQWFQNVQNDENEAAGSSHCDNLTTATLTVLGALNNSRQVEELKTRRGEA